MPVAWAGAAGWLFLADPGRSSRVARVRVADVTVRPVTFGETARFNAELDCHHWLGHRRLAAGQAASLTMVALDGKVLKGAWEELPDVKVKLFSALVHGEGVIIGQRKVPDDTTEVTQVLPLIDDIAAARAAGHGAGNGESDLAGVVVTADALHVHRDNLRQLTERGG